MKSLRLWIVVAALVVAGSLGAPYAQQWDMGPVNRVISWFTGNYNLAEFGAKCDGSSSDAAALAAANTAAAARGGGTIWVPLNCTTGSTITVGAGVTFRGTGVLKKPVDTSNGDATGTPLALAYSHVKATANNLTVFELVDNGASVQDMAIETVTNTNTSGCAISISNGEMALVQNVQVNGAFVAFCASAVQAKIQHSFAFNPKSATVAPGDEPATSSGRCFKITGGTNVYLYYNFCRGVSASFQPYAAIEVTGGGGHVLTGNQAVYPGNGIVVAPTATTMTWIFTNANVMDTGLGTGLLIQTATSGGLVGLASTGDWLASFTRDGVKTVKGASTFLDDVRLVAPTIRSNSRHGVNFASGDNLALLDGAICFNSSGAANTYDGVNVGTGAAGVKIEGNTIGGCGWASTSAVTPTQRYAVNTAASTISITSNSFVENVSNTINYGATPTAKYVRLNLGVIDDDLAAWTAFTPVVTCGSGSLTSYTATGRHRRDQGTSKTNFVEFKISVTTLGTCASYMSFTLPGGTTAQADMALATAESCNQGATYAARLTAGSATTLIQNYAGAVGVTSGSCLSGGGVYEAQ